MQSCYINRDDVKINSHSHSLWWWQVRPSKQVINKQHHTYEQRHSNRPRLTDTHQRELFGYTICLTPSLKGIEPGITISTLTSSNLFKRPANPFLVLQIPVNSFHSPSNACKLIPTNVMTLQEVSRSLEWVCMGWLDSGKGKQWYGCGKYGLIEVWYWLEWNRGLKRISKSLHYNIHVIGLGNSFMSSTAIVSLTTVFKPVRNTLSPSYRMPSL